MSAVNGDAVSTAVWPEQNENSNRFNKIQTGGDNRIEFQRIPKYYRVLLLS